MYCTCIRSFYDYKNKNKFIVVLKINCVSSYEIKIKKFVWWLHIIQNNTVFVDIYLFSQIKIKTHVHILYCKTDMSLNLFHKVLLHCLYFDDISLKFSQKVLICHFCLFIQTTEITFLSGQVFCNFSTTFLFLINRINRQILQCSPAAIFSNEKLKVEQRKNVIYSFC